MAELADARDLKTFQGPAAVTQIRPVLSFPQRFRASGNTSSAPIYEQCGARRDNFRDSAARFRTAQPNADRQALQDAILKLAAEVRQQLGLQLNISRTLIDGAA